MFNSVSNFYRDVIWGGVLILSGVQLLLLPPGRPARDPQGLLIRRRPYE